MRYMFVKIKTTDAVDDDFVYRECFVIVGDGLWPPPTMRVTC